jgi:hypothetical protein
MKLGSICWSLCKCKHKRKCNRRIQTQVSSAEGVTQVFWQRGLHKAYLASPT